MLPRAAGFHKRPKDAAGPRPFQAVMLPTENERVPRLVLLFFIHFTQSSRNWEGPAAKGERLA